MRRLPAASWSARGPSLALLALAVWPALAARGQPIEADRPGLLFAGSVLGPGRAQLELGALASRGGRADPRLLNFPSVLRLGIGRELELQIGHTLLNRLSTGSGGATRSQTGIGDLSLGVKFARPGEGLRPGVAAVASVNLPTGDRPFTSVDPVYSLMAQAGWTADDGLFLGVLAGYSRSTASGPDGASGTFAATIGVPLDARWSTYVEVGYLPGFAGAADSALAGAGVACILRERFQLDAFVNRGLNQATVDWGVGAGFSVRF